ncbi:MAG: molybdate ABC transporter substrate-binding protein [Aureliella sp.]
MNPKCNRSGSSLGLVVCAAAVVFAALIGLLVFGGRGSASSSDAKPHLLIMAAAGLREPMEQIAAEYEREHGVRIDLQFGGSNSLLNQLQIDRISAPDLFLAADQSYTLLAVEKGLAKETLPVATQRPVVIVRKDSPVKIATLDDLFTERLRLSIADPDQAAIGRTVKAALLAISDEHWNRLEQQVARWGVFKPTVNDVAGDVQIGAVDAGIVWDTTVSSPAYQKTLNVIQLPELSNRSEQVTLALLLASKQPDEARKFARYLTDSERGLRIFREHGFGPVPVANDASVRRENHDASAARPTAHDEDGSQ